MQVDVRISDSAKALISLSERKKTLKDEIGRIQERMDELEQEIILQMTNEQWDKLPVAGYTLYPKTNTYASMNKERKIEAMAWLCNNGYPDLVQKAVNARTLASTIKGIRKDGDDVPENLFNVNTKTTIGIRKA